jgi:hypothetical protein
MMFGNWISFRPQVKSAKAAAQLLDWVQKHINTKVIDCVIIGTIQNYIRECPTCLLLSTILFL